MSIQDYVDFTSGFCSRKQSLKDDR